MLMFKKILTHFLLMASSFTVAVPATAAIEKDEVSQVVGFNPEAQKPLTYIDPNLKLTLQKKNETLSVIVEQEKLPITVIDLSEEVGQVDSIIRVANNKAIVLGMANSSIATVGLIDLNTRKLTDHFRAYVPSLSPNKRYIAFVRFYPTHSGYPVEDQYRIYNIERGPSENRSALSDTTDLVNDAGFHVFDQLNRSNYVSSESDAHQMASAGFFWSADSSKVSFADYYKRELRMVTVSLRDVEPFQVKIMNLTEQLCDSGCEGVRLKSIEYTGEEFVATFRNFVNPGYKKIVRNRW